MSHNLNTVSRAELPKEGFIELETNKFAKENIAESDDHEEAPQCFAMGDTAFASKETANVMAWFERMTSDP